MVEDTIEDMVVHIQQHFVNSAKIKARAAQSLAPLIAEASYRMVTALRQGYKILSCGNGGSSLDAQHFASELMNRFMIERPPLPAIALSADSAVLTAIANDYSYEEVFSKQVKALGKPGDILLAISTSGQSKNVLAAIETAQQKGLLVVALTGRNGGAIAHCLSAPHIEIRVPDESIPRIQETHLLIIHCLCDMIDQKIFVGEGKSVEEPLLS